jgi:hypothetical protein
MDMTAALNWDQLLFRQKPRLVLCAFPYFLSLSKTRNAGNGYEIRIDKSPLKHSFGVFPETFKVWPRMGDIMAGHQVRPHPPIVNHRAGITHNQSGVPSQLRYDVLNVFRDWRTSSLVRFMCPSSPIKIFSASRNTSSMRAIPH